LFNVVITGVVCCAAVPHTSNYWFSRHVVQTLSRETLRVTNDNGIIQVRDAQITQCDLSATNGVVHVIDRVIKRRNVHKDFFDYIWSDMMDEFF